MAAGNPSSALCAVIGLIGNSDPAANLIGPRGVFLRGGRRSATVRDRYKPHGVRYSQSVGIGHFDLAYLSRGEFIAAMQYPLSAVDSLVEGLGRCATTVDDTHGNRGRAIRIGRPPDIKIT